jgi:hypothetical protein
MKYLKCPGRLVEHLNALWFDSRKVVSHAATGLEITGTTTENVLRITGLTAVTETLGLYEYEIVSANLRSLKSFPKICFRD